MLPIFHVLVKLKGQAPTEHHVRSNCPELAIKTAVLAAQHRAAIVTDLEALQMLGVRSGTFRANPAASR